MAGTVLLLSLLGFCLISEDTLDRRCLISGRIDKERILRIEIGAGMRVYGP